MQDSARRTIWSAGGKAVPVALRVWRGNQESLNVRVTGLILQLSDPSWTVRNRAMEQMIQAGWEILPVLENAIPPDDPEVAWRIRYVQTSLEDRKKKGRRREEARKVFLLNILGEATSRETLPVLLNVLKDDSALLRLVASESLAKLQPFLKKDEVSRISEQVLKDLRVQTDPLVRARWIRVLGALRVSTAAKPLAGLLQGGGEVHVHLLRSILFSLSRIGGAFAFQVIIQSLEDDRIYVRHAAGDVLRDVTELEIPFDPRSPDKKSLQGFQKWWERTFGKSWVD